MQPTSTGTTQLCVIYRATDGKIVHIHSESFALGMKLHSEDEMARRAQHHAQKAKRDVAGTKALHLRDPHFVGWPSRVDPKTHKIETTDPHSLKNPRKAH